MIQLNMTEYLTAYQPKITIYIPDMEIEQQAHEPKIDRPNNFPVQGIGAINFVAVDNIDSVLHHGGPLPEFEDVILSGAIGIEYQIFGRIIETGFQSAAVSAVLLMKNQIQVRVLRLEFRQQFPAVVGAAVVYDQDFVIISILARDGIRRRNETADRTGIVITREEYGQTGRFGRRIH